MIEAYKIGVSLALTGNLQAALAQLTRDFGTLNRAVRDVQMQLNDVTSSMRGLARVGQGAAQSWTQAANAMERAARAARSAGGAMAQPAGYTPPAANSNYPALPAVVGLGGPPGSGGGNQPPSAPRRLPAPYVPLMFGGGGGGGAPPPGGGGGFPPAPYGPNGFTMPGGPIQLNPGQLTGNRVPMPGMHDFAIAGLGFGAMGAAGGSMLENMFTARAEVDAQLAVLGVQGFSQQQREAALALAQKMQREVTGTSIGGGLHIIRDIQTMMQRPSDAMNEGLVRTLAQTGLVFRSLGKGDEGALLYEALQAAELRGALADPITHKADPQRMQRFLANVMNTAIITGGRVGPREINQFIRSGGLGAAQLNDKSLFEDMITPILSMRAAGAGSGLQGLAMQFTAGKQSDAAVKMLGEMGMFGPGGLAAAVSRGDAAKVGIGQWRLRPEAIPAFRDIATRPVDAIMGDMLKFVDAYNAKHYRPTDDPEEISRRRQATGMSIASRIPGGKIFGDVIRNFALIDRDREAAEAARKRFPNPQAAYEQVVATNPQVQVQAFHAAVNALMVEMGGSTMKEAISVLKGLTAGLNSMSEWAKANPEMASVLVKTAAGLSALATGIGALSAAAFVAVPMFRVASWMAGGIGAAGAGGVGALAAGATGLTLGGIVRAVPGLGLLAAGAYGLHEGLDAGAKAIYGNRASVSANLDARGFSLFDRSTWADPNASWWNMAPRALPSERGYQPGARAGDTFGRSFAPTGPAIAPRVQLPDGPIPVTVTNGRDLAAGVTQRQIEQASRPSSGTANADVRLTPWGAALGAVP